jgi:hypothetical protein
MKILQSTLSLNAKITSLNAKFPKMLAQLPRIDQLCPSNATKVKLGVMLCQKVVLYRLCLRRNEDIINGIRRDDDIKVETLWSLLWGYG